MKPKENTIAKIDLLAEELARHDSLPVDRDLVIALQQRCHTMNIHKATVAYFKRVKLVFSQALEISSQSTGAGGGAGLQALERDMRDLLDAKNG